MRCFLIWLAMLASAFGQTPVDLYLDMEAGTNGQPITTNLLNACTHAVPGAGRWTLNRGHPKGCTDCWQELAAVTDFVVLTNAGTNGVWPLRSAVSVNGTVYDDAIHTRVFGKGLNARNQGAQFNFAAPHWRVSIGYYYTMAVGYRGQSIGNILSTDLLNFADSNAWEFDIQGGSIINSNALVFVHSQAGGPAQAGTIPVTRTKTYWITQLWDGLNGVCKVEVYDPVTWSKLSGTTQLTLSNQPCWTFQFGDLENTNYQFAVTNCFGNLVMDWTTAVFPLLLPAVAPPSPSYLIVSWTPTNAATLESAAGAAGPWQTWSNNATPPVAIPVQHSLPAVFYRVKSTNTTLLDAAPR
ncbi:MAG: hypothetical protein U1F98_15520 [Verrucomicrobiota bacterium]